MKLPGLLLCVVLTGASSCISLNNKPPHTAPAVTRDTLLYTFKADGPAACVNKPDSECKVSYYPVFKNQPVLNDTVAHILAAFKQANLHLSLLRQDSSFASIQISTHEIGQNAKSHQTHFINWNTKAAKKIELGDIFASGYEQKLTSIAENIFRKEEKLNDTASLAKDYLFKNGKFALNNNYVITPLGIRFVYNEGEIKPVSAGKTDILVPFSEIKTILKPNTVVKQYIK